MNFIISDNIEPNETMIHFLFDRNFRHKLVSNDNIIDKDVFMPNKGGVSLQRAYYCNEHEAKSRAIAVAGNSRRFAGFICFLYSNFLTVVEDYKRSRSEFEVEIVYQPLDENQRLISNRPIFQHFTGNPSHADLKYINPAMKGDETPNIAIRSFSRKLAKVCLLRIDNNHLGYEFASDGYLL